MILGCNCKHNKEAINEGKKNFAKLRDLFIKRMTIDSEHNDRRRKDYNQAIFCDYGRGVHEAVWNKTTMEMVLQCFDDAVKDWRKSFCDVENCNRK